MTIHSTVSLLWIVTVFWIRRYLKNRPNWPNWRCCSVAKGPMTHGTFNARNYDAGILTHGILTQGGIWRRDTRGDFWRTEFWRIYIFNDFWRTEFWRRWILTHFFGGWFLTHLFEGWFLTHFLGVIFDAFQFVHGIWRTFLGGDFWRIYLGDDFWRIFGGWFLTHFSFVHGIWRTFGGGDFWRISVLWFSNYFNLVYVYMWSLFTNRTSILIWNSL